MVGLAQRLVALREVVAFLHFEAFKRFDQLVGVGRPLNFDISIRPSRRSSPRSSTAHSGRATGRTDRFRQPRLGLVEELVKRRRVERSGKDRNVTVDADEAVDLGADGRHVGEFDDGAVAGKFILLGQTEIVGLIGDRSRHPCQRG